MKGMTVFACMSDIRENLIEESLELFEGKAAAPSPKPQSAFSRVTNSGWFVAAVCTLVAIFVMGGIIWAGFNPPSGRPDDPVTDTPSENAETTLEPVVTTTGSEETTAEPDETTSDTSMSSGKWDTYRDPEYEGLTENFHPAAGYTYTADGFTIVPADYTDIQPYLAIQSKEKVNLKDGVYLEYRVDDFSYEAANHWIAFTLWDTVNARPGNTTHGKGWLGLIRTPGEGGTGMCQSFAEAMISQFGQTDVSPLVDEDGREIYTLEIEWKDGVYDIRVCGVTVGASATDVTGYLETLDPDGEFYVGIHMYAAIQSGTAAGTITKFGTSAADATVPVGSDSKEPEENLNRVADFEDCPAPEPGQPALLWNAAKTSMVDDPVGTNLEITAKSDLSYHFKMKGELGYMRWDIKNSLSYRAEEYPVLAILFRNFRHDGGSLYWYAGDIVNADSDHMLKWSSYADGVSGQYSAVYGEKGEYTLVMIDLNGANDWKGRINGLRLDFSSEYWQERDGEWDICYMGMFDTVDNARAYATDYTDKAETTDPEETTEPENPTENEGHLFESFNHVDRFSAEHADYIKYTQCKPVLNADGTITFIGTWDIDAYVEPTFTIDYYHLMQNFNGTGETFNKNKLANARGDGNIIAFKVKSCPIMVADDSVRLHLTAGLGETLLDYYVFPVNTIKGDGSVEYIYFDLSDEVGYENLFINTMELNWAYTIGNEKNLGSTCTLISIDMYATMKEALIAAAESEVTESETETKTEPETETEPDGSPEKPSEGLQIVSGGNNAIVTGIGTCKDKKIVIPSVSPDGKPVTGIDFAAFQGNTSITGVVIPDTVTMIHGFTFQGCSSLTSVTIPDSVVEIEQCAFAGCAALTHVTIPNNVKIIYSEVFSGCTMLESVSVPNSVMLMGDNVFQGCSSLAYHTENGVKYLGNRENPYVVLCEVPRNVQTFSIPDSTRIILSDAFRECFALEDIRIPDSVMNIGASAFQGCISLTSVHIEGSLTRIDEAAFEDCSALVSVRIEGDVVEFMEGTFRNCSAMTEFYMAGSASIVYAGVFSNCSSMVNFYMGQLECLGNGAFSGCTSLTSLTLPDGLTTIDSGVFRSCDSLTTITLPDTLMWVDGNSFKYCKNLATVYYKGTARQWEQIEVLGSQNNDCLPETVKRYDYSETQPTEPGNYWHYVDGVATPW